MARARPPIRDVTLVRVPTATRLVARSSVTCVLLACARDVARKCRRAKARPDPVFRYVSKDLAASAGRKRDSDLKPPGARPEAGVARHTLIVGREPS